MRARARWPWLVSAVTALLFIFAAPAQAQHDQEAHWLLYGQVQQLRDGVAWQRNTTWHYQDMLGQKRWPSSHSELRQPYTPYLHWLVQLWARRHLQAVHAYKAAMAARPAHYAGWWCIHAGAYPGAPHEGNGTNGAYNGPLQMTEPWLGQYGDWNALPIVAVFAVAERVAASHGFAYSFMKGQWPNTYPPCARLF